MNLAVLSALVKPSTNLICERVRTIFAIGDEVTGPDIEIRLFNRFDASISTFAGKTETALFSLAFDNVSKKMIIEPSIVISSQFLFAHLPSCSADSIKSSPSNSITVIPPKYYNLKTHKK